MKEAGESRFFYTRATGLGTPDPFPVIPAQAGIQ